MQTLRIGVLSDTHLYQLTTDFKHTVSACFADVSVIFHAGDLTSISLLEAFRDKEVYAVHGNMCDSVTCRALPRKRVIEIGGFSFGLIHKPRGSYSYDFEYGLLDEFDPVNCIVYGHTHAPTCRKQGDFWFINPGSFQSTGAHGASGTYAILEIDTEIRCQIKEISTKI